MDPAIHAVAVAYRDEDLDKTRADPTVVYLWEGDLRTTSALEIPLRFVVNGLDMFHARDRAGHRTPYLPVNVVDFALQLGYSLEQGEHAGDEVIDPGEYGDVLRFSIAGDRAIFESFWTGAVAEVPLTTATRDITEFMARVRRLLIEINPDAGEHPQLGPWIRGERFMPNDEDDDHVRRAPSTLVLPERTAPPIVAVSRTLQAQALAIDFALDADSLADAEQADLAKESWIALGQAFLPMPLLVVADGQPLLWTTVRTPEGAWERRPFRYCRLIQAAWIFSHPRSDLAWEWRNWTERRWWGLKDVDAAPALELSERGGEVRLESPDTGLAVTVPGVVFVEAATAFIDRVFAFLQERLPEAVEKARLGMSY